MTDDEFVAVYEIAPEVIKLAMLLAIVTGLRQSDILNLKFSGFTDDGLELRTGKTGKLMIYEPTPELESIVERAKKLREKANVRGMYLRIGRGGQKYSSSGFKAMLHRIQRKALEKGVITERFTFHDLRAKAASDSDDDKILGHANAQTNQRHYKRKPYRVSPIRPRVLDNS